MKQTKQEEKPKQEEQSNKEQYPKYKTLYCQNVTIARYDAKLQMGGIQSQTRKGDDSEIVIIHLGLKDGRDIFYYVNKVLNTVKVTEDGLIMKNSEKGKYTLSDLRLEHPVLIELSKYTRENDADVTITFTEKIELNDKTGEEVRSYSMHKGDMDTLYWSVYHKDTSNIIAQELRKKKYQKVL